VNGRRRKLDQGMEADAEGGVVDRSSSEMKAATTLGVRDRAFLS